MSDDNEMSAEMFAELVQALWVALEELYGGASVYPCDDVRRMAHDIASLRAERDELRAKLEKMDGDARWTISDVEHDLTDMRLRAEGAEAERDALLAELVSSNALVQALREVVRRYYVPIPGPLLARIDALLNKGGGDE